MTGIYVGNSCFMMVILTILLQRIGFYVDKGQSKRYAMLFIGAVEIYVLMDALFVTCFLKEHVNVTAFRVIAFSFYLVYVTMPYVWHLFMQSYMDIRCGLKIRLLETLPAVILLFIVIKSSVSGNLWQIDANGIYTRGPLFDGFCVLNLFYYCFAFGQTCYILVSKKRRAKHYTFKSSMFSALPLVGILVNTYVIPLYGVYPFQPYCLVTGVLLAYLYMVEHQKKQLEIEQKKQLVLALEHEKDAARKAKEAGAVKDTFLANMSHDIRTPMNAILGFSDIIAKHPGDETIVRNAVSKIQASGDVLMKLINDVLDLSKIESGKLTVEKTATDLKQMSEKLDMIMEYSIEKKNIQFQIVNGLQHPYVWCDAIKVQQILVNILNNAVKFTPEGGKITLRYEEIPISEEVSEYRISVQDTGIGMDEEFQKHAFEVFERERTSTESKTEGTGLGLAIVKKLIDLMDGQVTIQSKVGQGTKITICLYLMIAEQGDVVEKKKEYALIANPNLAGMRILLTEDNELNMEIAKEILTSAGMTVDWVEDGSTCLTRLEQVSAGYYQLILMDIQMPKLNGYETAKRIRQMQDTQKAQIPIIAMTANAFSDDRKRAFEAGMNGFITKPIDVDQMMRTIQETLSNGIIDRNDL